MPPPERMPPMTARPSAERRQLIFEGLTDPRLPRELVLERLRQLLKDAPDVFERRMARMPLVLLPDSDAATARRYQQLLAHKGILCRIVPPDADHAAPRPAPSTQEGAATTPSWDDRGQAPPDLPRGPVAAPSTALPNDRLPIFNLALALCFNPRGVIGRVEAAAPYRATLILAAGVGLAQGGGAALTEHPSGAAAILLTALAILIVAPVLGIVLVYVRGFLLHAAGRLLKGRASPRELRVALAWSETPLLLGGLITLLQSATVRLLAAVPVQTADHGLPLSLSRAGFGLLQAAVGLWALSLLLYTVAEIQGFSLCRALANIALAVAAVLVPLAVLGGMLIGTGLMPFGS